MSKRVTLLFTHAHTYLGELTTHEGAFDRCVLSTEGEERLGHMVHEWQVQGIGAKGKHAHERIKAKEKGFLAAFLGWALDHSVETVQLSEAAMPCWEKMIQLPFEPMERFVLIASLSQLRAEEVPKWFKALDAVHHKV